MPAGGQQHSGSQSRHFALRPKRDPREPLTIRVTYRGGPECWYEIHARGVVVRRPGTVALHDLMAEINRT